MTENLTPDSQKITPRHVFGNLPKYAAGKPPQKVEGLQQYKLSSNENPLGPVPAVQSVIQKFLYLTNRQLVLILSRLSK